jgi:hypothetical protein
MRANTDETLTLADDVSPATLAPERYVPNYRLIVSGYTDVNSRSFANMHSRNTSTGAFSTSSGHNPMAPGGRSRAASEATLAPLGTSAGASTRSATTSTYTLEGYVI